MDTTVPYVKSNRVFAVPNGCDVPAGKRKPYYVTGEESAVATKSLCERQLGLANLEDERDIRPAHVGDLLRHMQRDTFNWELVTFIDCTCGEEHNGSPPGTVFRMNGGHTSTARLKMPPHYAPNVEIRVIHYHAPTEAGLRALYSTIDRGKARSVKHVMKSYMGGDEEYQRLKLHARNNLPAGLKIWQWETLEEQLRHDEEDVVYELLTRHRRLTLSVGEFLSEFSAGAEYRHVYRKPTVGAMFATFDASPYHAYDFWVPVVNGVGFESEDDPRRRLYLLLQSVVVGSTNRGRRGSEKKEARSAEDVYRVCIRCFNAWRLGESMKKAPQTPSHRPNPVE